jgi:tRNA threonylcarbamoyl adenosine modification protein YjeE
MNLSINNLTQEELEQRANVLAARITSPTCIALWGEMGAGKSTFARAFIKSFLPTIDVPSPTFTLIQTYTTSKGEIWHCDLYRLGNSDEIQELGLLEAFHNNICLVEWPERLESFLPQPRYNIFIGTNNAQSRSYRCEYLP